MVVFQLIWNNTLVLPLRRLPPSRPPAQPRFHFRLGIDNRPVFCFEAHSLVRLFTGRLACLPKTDSLALRVAQLRLNVVLAKLQATGAIMPLSGRPFAIVADGRGALLCFATDECPDLCSQGFRGAKTHAHLTQSLIFA